MRVLEKDIERRVCEKVKQFGILNIKMSTHTETGWPDRMFVIPGGRPLFIEFKVPGGKLSKRQFYIHKVLEVFGYQVQTHDNEESAIRAISEAIRSAQLPEKSDEVLVAERLRGSIFRPRTR